MDARIYVATHKRDDHLLKIDNPIYIPIHCGKAIYKDSGEGYLPELGDDTGDNISSKNPNYCELTAMYWAWKNDDLGDNDIIGINHYRRYFSEPGSDDTVFMTKETMEKLLEDSDFIINGCGTDYDDTRSDEEAVYYGYKSSHIISDLDNALEGIKIIFPDLYEKIHHQVMHSGAMCLCNMMICKKYNFKRYCEFIFPVMSYVESKIDFNDDRHSDDYNCRVFGFLGERLFRPWLIATGLRGIQAPGLDWEKVSGYKWV